MDEVHQPRRVLELMSRIARETCASSSIGRTSNWLAGIVESYDCAWLGRMMAWC